VKSQNIKQKSSIGTYLYINTLAMKKKLISMLMLGTIVAALATGCAAPREAPPKPPAPPAAPSR
jgi:hypothetical protein